VDTSVRTKMTMLLWQRTSKMVMSVHDNAIMDLQFARNHSFNDLQCPEALCILPTLIQFCYIVCRQANDVLMLVPWNDATNIVDWNEPICLHSSRGPTPNSVWSI